MRNGLKVANSHGGSREKLEFFEQQVFMAENCIGGVRIPDGLKG